MKQFKWIASFLFIVVNMTFAEDDFLSPGFNGFMSFGPSPFPIFPQNPFRFGSFGPRYPFGRDAFRPLGPGFYPPKWNLGVLGGEFLERVENQAMCSRAMPSEEDDTKIIECAICFANSQTQRGIFSRVFDLKNYTECAKTYLGEAYISCADALTETDSGNVSSAIDVFRFKGCLDYNRWTKALGDCESKYSEDQAGFFQCMVSAKTIRMPRFGIRRPLVNPTSGPSANPNELPENSNDQSANPSELPANSNDQSANPSELPANSNDQSANPSELPANSNDQSANPSELPANSNDQSANLDRTPPPPSSEPLPSPSSK